MGKNTGLIIGGILAAGTIAFWKYRTTAAQIQLEFVNASFKFKNVLNSILNVQFRVVNPSMVGLSVDSISGDISADGVELGKLNHLQGFKVPARGKESVVIAINLSNLTAAKQIFSFLLSGKKPTVKISGFMNIGGRSIPFTQSVVGSVSQ